MRPIDADKLSKQYETSMCELLKSTNCENISIEALSLLCGAKLIADAPTIDAAPVKHGRWIPVMNGIDDDTNPAFDCSECDTMCRKQYNYCPKCGATMDLEEQK